MKFIKDNLRYLIVFVVLSIFLIVFLIYQSGGTSSKSTPSKEDNVYKDDKINFVYPYNYKLVNEDEVIELKQTKEEYPKIEIRIYEDYVSPVKVINDYTNEIKNNKNYSIIQNMMYGDIEDKKVYNSIASYNVVDNLIIDNMYSFKLGSDMYLISSKELNTFTDEVNNIVKSIINSFQINI